MIMKKKYNSDKVSKIFNTPKSTLRYWESEGLISAIRNRENNYREYDINNLIEICEIKFYRSLNFPVKKFKEVWQTDVNNKEELLKNHHKEIEISIEKQYKTLKKIEKMLYNIDSFKKLKDNPYELDTPKFDKIFHLRLNETEKVLKYINDQNILSFVVDYETEKVTSYGAAFNNDEYTEPEFTSDILWEKDLKSHKYITCLLEAMDDVIIKENLDIHLKHIKSINKKPGVIIAKYLMSEEKIDYFQCWIEII